MDWKEIPPQVALSEEDVIRRLFAAGYLGVEWDAVRRLAFDAPETRTAIEQYRAFNGVAGDESELVNHLMRPRCGLPDQLARADASLCKWPMLDVTASQQLGGLNPLPTDVEKSIYVEALQNWNEVCGIKLRLIEAFGGTNIYSQPGPCQAGVLAYSYLPCGASQSSKMAQVYNRATNWTRSLLLQVATHELGHAIGLDHGPQGALMMPTADGRITKPQTWDIAQVRQRYGDPQPGKDPSPVPGETPIPTPTPTDGSLVILPQTLVAGRYRLVPDTAAASDPWEM